MSDALPQPPGPASEPVPVCPRHPDRESYVRCQRCERPTCPQCQRPAAVGIQCVDCVARGAREQRTARTQFGARPTQGRPAVTLTLIGICVGIFLLQQLPGVGSALLQAFAFAPVVAAAEPWRFLTAGFLHSPTFLLHIAFNLYALWLVGQYLEPMFGRARYLALFLLSAVGGSVGVLLLADPADASWYTPVIGASGAVFGLFGALLVVQRRLGLQSGQIVVLLVINGVLGFVVPGIAWQAHLGGLLTGAAVAAAVAYAPRQRRAVLQVAGLVAVAALLALAGLLRLAAV